MKSRELLEAGHLDSNNFNDDQFTFFFTRLEKIKNMKV